MKEIEIAGKTYPLTFSMLAAKKFIARYGSVEDVWQKLHDMPLDAQIDEIIWILALLLEQGCAYKRLYDGEDIQPPPVESLEILLDLNSLSGLMNQIGQAVVGDISPEIQVEVEKKTGAKLGDLITLDTPGPSITDVKSD